MGYYLIKDRVGRPIRRETAPTSLCSYERARRERASFYQEVSEVQRSSNPFTESEMSLAITGKNREGVSYSEWLAAANLKWDLTSRAAWLRGEDPTEHRAGRD